jgi:predicted XRE-type DNA-binding protein
MKNEKLEVVRGSGNVFRDVGRENADAEQFKAILATEIIKTLDRERLTVRAAHGRTGIAAADFSRIRNADLARFTVDRLMSILNRLGSRVEVKVRVRRAEMAVDGRRHNQTQTPAAPLGLSLSHTPLPDQPGCRKGFTISSGQRTARPGRSSE